MSPHREPASEKTTQDGMPVPAGRTVTRFGLIRHAETVWNRERRVQGQLDSPLTPEGERQAERWGRALRLLPWSRILASDTGRAVATAAIINAHLNLAVENDPRLRELDWGRWTSRTLARIRAEDAAEVAAQEAAGWKFRPPGGESRRQQMERSRQALIDTARRWPGACILVVTHEGVIKGLAHHLCGRAYVAADAVCLQPYHLHWLEVIGGRMALAELNARALA
ncbi:MAG TPA: histidine phosphatase family protein [Desulfobacterales bacterium]|nr:histidine phosphatase family protein [Desulfobacterales bacterium]